VIWTLEALCDIGRDALELSDLAGATAAFDEAIAEASNAMAYAVIPAWFGHAEVLLQQGRLEAALARAREAATVARELRPLCIEALRVEGESLIALGRAEEGERVLRAAQEEARSMGVDPGWWRVTLALADSLDARGRGTEAGAQRAAVRTVLEQVASTL